MSESPTPEQLLEDAAWLRRLAVTLAGEADADDLVQESRIAAWTRKPDAERSLRPWLAKVLRDVAGMRRRSAQRRAVREQVAGRDAQEIAAPDTLLDQMRLHRLLVDLVLELDEPFRSTIVARFVEGKTSAAIAKALGVSAATVRWRLREGLARLRVRLDAERGDRKSWAPAVLAFSRRGVQVARTKQTIAIVLLLLALLGCVALIMMRPSRDNSRDDLAGTTHPGSNWRAGNGPDAIAATTYPAWFGQPGVAPKRIAGRVTFDGAPVAGATVSLHPFPIGTVGMPAPTRRTAEDGGFDFGPVPSGLYNVGAHADDRADAILRIALDDPTLQPPADQLELRLGPCSGSVSGKIVDAAGSPIPRARVRREGTIGADADAEGNYRICMPTGDAIELTYGADGYGTVALAIDVLGEAHRDVVLVPEATLPVRAVGRNGAPIANALISVHPADWAPDRPLEGHAITDADGQAQITVLVPGAYTVWGSDGHASTASAIKVLVVAGPNPAVTVTLLELARIRGKVIGANRPVAGAAVSVVRASPKASSMTAHSQADGSFVLDGVITGDLAFLAPPYRVVSPTSFRVPEPRDYDVVIEVATLGSITGVVTRHGKPVAGVEICCVSQGPQSKARTDAAGRYEYRGVAAGSYELSAQTLDAFAKPVKVTIADREAQTADLALDLGASISGTVVDQDGKPVAGAYVVWQQPAIDDSSRCNTDAAGRYRCAAMSGGAGRYVASVFPRAPTQAPFPPADGPYPTVELKDGSSAVDNVRLAVRYEQLSISGVVIDDTGAPLADARVEAQSMQGDAAPAFVPWLRAPTTFTDGSGAFVLGGLVAGRYAVRAHGSDGADVIAPNIAAGATNVTLQALRPASIRGTLTGFAAAPVVYARPIGTLTGDARAVWGVVDGSTFTVTGLPAGRYLVDAQTQAEGDARIVELRSGETGRVTLTAHGSGSVEGTVLDFRTQKPLAGAICQPFLSSGDEIGVTSWDLPSDPRSNAAGRVVLDPAPVGDIVVACIMPAGGWSRPVTRVSVRANERATIRLYSVEQKTTVPGTLGVVFDGTVTTPRIAAVVPGGAGAKAGLVVGDVVVAVDGASVEELDGNSVHVLIESAPANSNVTLVVVRGTARRTITAKLGPRG